MLAVTQPTTLARESLSIQNPFPFLACLWTPGQVLLICSPLTVTPERQSCSVGGEPPALAVM